MKVAMIRPAFGTKGTKSYSSLALLEPLTFATLAGVTPADVELRFFDERFESVPTDEPFDLVAMSVETFAARRAYQLSRFFRSAGTPVVVGGFHPTLVPDEAEKFADVVAIGEGEEIWPQILLDARTGNLKKRYIASRQDEMILAPSDRSIFSGKKYLPMGMVQFIRGCRYNCDFCSICRVYPGTLRHRKIPDVVAELEKIKKNFIFFVDDNIIADRKAARELFSALKPLKIKWASQASLDLVDDLQLLDLLVESGCFSLIIGLESLNQKNLTQMRKGWVNRKEGYGPALDELKKRGILVYATFVFGYDGDDLDSFNRTVDFALEKRIFLANFNVLQPFPGTLLYERLQAEGRLTYPQWWLDPKLTWDQAVFRPRGMSPKQLSQGCAGARKRFNSLSGIFRRACDLQANLHDPFRAAIYFSGNLISRHDIHRKQKLSLGFADEPINAENLA